MTQNNKCPQCHDRFRIKKDLEQHYNRFHRPPTINKNGTITVNASDQIILEVKGSMTWDEYFKSLNPKKVHKSFFEGGLELQGFELRNDIEFVMLNDGIRYRGLISQ